MSFLLPYDVSKNARTKYLYYFYKSLKNEKIDIIPSTASWINKSTGYEAVIIHWPEYLPSKNRNSEFEFLKFTIDRLNYFKKVSRIIYFVHNEQPHTSLNKIHKKLYEAVIDSADLIFHFSNYSKDLYKLKYKFNKKQFVLSHGNYINLDNGKFEKNKFVKKFKLNPTKKIVTTIGAIRNNKEMDLLYNFSRQYLNEDCHFIYAGQLAVFTNPRSSRRFIYILKLLIFKIFQILKKTYRIFKLKKLNKNIRIFANPISDDLLVSICKGTDVLLIIRNNSLNSGNISLGFSFGCYVVGPKYGNIEEILIQNNNMVYPLENIRYKNIVNQSLKNINCKIMEKNRKTALKDWDWGKLAKEFNKILKSTNSI